MNIWYWNGSKLVIIWKWITIAVDPRIYSPLSSSLCTNKSSNPIRKDFNTEQENWGKKGITMIILQLKINK